MKNWFGIEFHITDEMIHWSERKPHEMAASLRPAYDKIVKAGFRIELDILLDARHHATQQNCWDEEAGSSL